MAKKQNQGIDLKNTTNLLQNLLAIELWRGGLSQKEIGKRLGVATGSVNKMLKGVNRVVSVIASDKE